MRTFSTRIVEEIKAREIVEQLVIDGVAVLDLFENQLVGTTYQGEYEGLLAFIQHFSDGGTPGKKVKYLKGKDRITEFEYISKHLRIYAIQQPDRKLIIYGGKKKLPDSSDNIAAFRRVKDEYIFFLKQQHEKRKAN